MSKNEFKAGNKVKIGFMVLTVIEQSKDSVYYRPKAWILESSKGVRYQFTPYYGLERLQEELFMECLCVDCGVNKGDLISPIFIDPPVYQCGDCAEIAYEQSIKQ